MKKINVIKITDYKLFKEALDRLSEGDFIPGAILAYNKQEKNVAESVNELTLETKNKVEQQIKDLRNSYEKLKKEIEKKLQKEVEEDITYNDLACTYVLNNIIKLCPDNKLLNYYERLNFCLKRLSNNFSLRLQTAIMLRSTKIIEDLYMEGKLEEINSFLNLIESGNEKDDNIIYTIYYGLYDGNFRENKFFDFSVEDNFKVAKAILNSSENLPDSIIKHISEDSQFKNVNPIMINLVFNRFFMPNKSPLLLDNLNNTRESAQKLFNNSIDDYNEEAEFLNLKELFDSLIKDLISTKLEFKFNKLCKDVLSGDKKLKPLQNNKEENTSYGSIR